MATHKPKKPNQVLAEDDPDDSEDERTNVDLRSKIGDGPIFIEKNIDQHRSNRDLSVFGSHSNLRKNTAELVQNKVMK